jgi:hypothetical protein
MNHVMHFAVCWYKMGYLSMCSLLPTTFNQYSWLLFTKCVSALIGSSCGALSMYLVQ